MAIIKTPRHRLSPRKDSGDKTSITPDSGVVEPVDALTMIVRERELETRNVCFPTLRVYNAYSPSAAAFIAAQFVVEGVQFS